MTPPVCQGVVLPPQVVTQATPIGPTNQLRPVYSTSNGNDPRHSNGPYTGNGFWSDSVFDCCAMEMGSFCMALWCPCVQLGINTQKSGLGSFQKYCLLASIPEAVNYVLQVWMFFSGYVVSEDEGVTGYRILQILQFISSFWVLAILLHVRHRLRDMYSITGETDASACCLVYCCGPCTISQEARHIARVKGELPWPFGQSPSQPGVIIGYPVMPSTVVQAGQVPGRSPTDAKDVDQNAGSPAQAFGVPAQAYGGIVVAQPLPAQRGNVAQVWPDMPVAQATVAPGPQTEPLPAGTVMGMPPQDQAVPGPVRAQQQQEQQQFQQQFHMQQNQQQQPILATLAANAATSGSSATGRPRNID